MNQSLYLIAVSDGEVIQEGPFESEQEREEEAIKLWSKCDYASDTLMKANVNAEGELTTVKYTEEELEELAEADLEDDDEDTDSEDE